MGDARHKRPYMRGPRREMTEAWKRDVVAKLREIKMTRAALAAAVGAKSAASITQMLGRTQHSSVWVDKVCRVLQIDPPSIGVAEGFEDEALRILRSLDPSDRELATAYLPSAPARLRSAA